MTAQARPHNVTATGVVISGPCTYRGLSVRDTSALANTITVYDGTTAAGTVLATFELDAGQHALDNVADGVRCDHGIYLDTTGTVAGSVRVG